MTRGKLLGLFPLLIVLIGCVPQMGGMSGTDKKTVQFHYQLGITYLSEGKTPQAIKELTTAQGLHAGNADIEHALGLAYQQKGMYEKAIEQYNKALELDGKLTEARNNFGYCPARYSGIRQGDRAIH